MSKLRKTLRFVPSLLVMIPAAACTVADGTDVPGSPTEPPERATTSAASPGAATLSARVARAVNERCGADCEILSRSSLRLPATGMVATVVKVRSADGAYEKHVVADDGRILDLPALFRAEALAVRERSGGLSDDLRRELARAKDDAVLDVAIWSNVQVSYPPKEALLGSTALLQEHLGQRRRDIDAAKAELLRTLEADPSTSNLRSDPDSPLVRASLAASVVRKLAHRPDVALVDRTEEETTSCGYPGTATDPTCRTWKGAVRADYAMAAYGVNGAGQRVCIREPGKAVDPSLLNIAATANPGGAAGDHAQAMAGVVASTTAGEAGAPGALLYMANDGYTGTGNIEYWCRVNGATTINWSSVGHVSTAGGPSTLDYLHDWVAKNWPYSLFVASAGNAAVAPQHYVGNRSFNTVIVGGAQDLSTPTRSDDLEDPWTSWGNFTTPSNDFELPHVAAPSFGSFAAGMWGNASSIAAAETTSVIALMSSRDPSRFDGWPELKRATLLATANGALGQPWLERLPSVVDRRSGVGLIDAAAAVDLAAPDKYLPPGSAAAAKGRHARTVTFGSDFSGSESTFQYNVASPIACGTGPALPYRMRVVVAWDASPASCGTYGFPCASDTLDGDIDLHVYRTSSTSSPVGSAVCHSQSNDSSYEVCDFPVACGETYAAKITKHSVSAPSTYMGVAWAPHL